MKKFKVGLGIFIFVVCSLTGIFKEADSREKMFYDGLVMEVRNYSFIGDTSINEAIARVVRINELNKAQSDSLYSRFR